MKFLICIIVQILLEIVGGWIIYGIVDNFKRQRYFGVGMLVMTLIIPIVGMVKITLIL